MQRCNYQAGEDNPAFWDGLAPLLRTYYAQHLVKAAASQSVLLSLPLRRMMDC
jgi:hypothetical protein